MEMKIINGLVDIGYQGPIVSEGALKSSIEEGTKSVEYTKLINFLTNEYRALCNIDEKVNVIDCPEDSVSFVMEVGSFLKELGCPYTVLTDGHVSDRLQNKTECLLLLDYLLTELMAARILQEKKPNKNVQLKLNETLEAANLRKILTALKFPKPPPNITIETLFQKLVPVIQSTVSKAGNDLLGKPAFFDTLSSKQWEHLNEIQNDLHDDFKIRREMLMTRLDVTIQSFQWSDKIRDKDEQIEQVYCKKRVNLKLDPSVNLASLLAAREDIAIIEKTSSSAVRKNTRSQLNKVIIGEVPDRGGRTTEQAPPPPEMPSWQPRQAGPSGGGNASRGRGAMSRQQNYSKGNYGHTKEQSGSIDNHGSYGGGNYNNRNFSQDNRRNCDNYSQGRSFDSAGSYGEGKPDYQYEQNTKRAKTYDSFQSNRMTYADQYVQENQHNQRYQGNGDRGRSDNRRGRGGRGHSNYYRGRNNY